jgi:hypothetical protein
MGPLRQNVGKTSQVVVAAVLGILPAAVCQLIK